MTDDEFDKQGRPDGGGPSRRQVVLGGAAAAGSAWAAPSILRVDRAAAAPGSCVEQTIAWNSVSGSNPWTATATSGPVTVTVTISAASTGAVNAYLSGGNLITSCGPPHSIGDTFDFTVAFSNSAGVVCSARSRILDADQNDIGLGCPTVSRFRDEISNLTGAGLTTTTEGGLTEVSPGVFASSLSCKTGDTENLILDWTVRTGVTGGGFRWTMGSPPNGSTTLDFQLIKLEPFTVCVTGGAGGTSGARASAGSPRALPSQD